MSNEELMEIRYKVIAGVPFSKFEIGDILLQMMVKWHPEKEAEMMWRRVAGEKHSGGQSVGVPMIKDPEKYPHLFKKLEWWEDRKPEDMPEYVKRESGKIFKIDKPSPGLVNNYGIMYLSDRDFNGVKNFIYLRTTIPATKEEYENQTKR